MRSRTLKLSRAFESAHGTVIERELLLVTATAEDGARGHGEAAPLEGYSRSSPERVREALDRYGEVLDRHHGPPGSLLDACRDAADVPEALAAVDLALWDLAGRRAGRPVAELLSSRPAEEVRVNATISAPDRAAVAEQAAAAARAGFGCVKLKVGIGDDAGRVAAARAAAGPLLALRLDANGAWSVEQAVAAIAALEPAGLELVEEPVHGLHAVREVRERVAARVSIDETAAEPGALGAGVADAVCLKVSRCGGISALLAAASLVRAAGAEVYLSSTYDGPCGIAAAVHAAAALAPLPACGLGTLELFADVRSPLAVSGGRIAVPRSPGLGV